MQYSRSASTFFLSSLVIASLVLASLVFGGAIAMAQTNALPMVSQPLVPASVAPGSGAFTLTVNGTGFASGAVVNWNGSARSTSFVSGSTLQASITAADVASKGTATVTVTNPTPGGGVSNRIFFPVRTALASVAAAVDSKFTAGVTGAFASVAGDFNNDGKQDLVVGVTHTDQTGTLYYYRGSGAGSFARHSRGRRRRQLFLTGCGFCW